MAILNINKKTFEKEIGKFDEKMQERIALFGTPIETINDDEIQLEIFPNRPDMLSYQGFKRSFLGFLGKKTGLAKYKLNSPLENYKIIIDKSVEDVRPFTTCAIVKGLNFNDEKIKEIVEVQEKLHLTMGRKRKKLAIGIYPLEKITLPITFKALEPDRIKFMPLEANREMSGLEILQRHPTGRDYAHLLAGKHKFPIFTDADNNILSMPPIINSHNTGKITEKTKDVFVECSGFDFDVLEKCLNIVVTTLADMGGKIYQMELLYKKKKLTPNLSGKEIKLSSSNANNLLGLNLSKKEIKQLIEKMGHDYIDGLAKTPSWRTDILHEVDLIEDIAIAYGYENFEPIIPSISTIGKEDFENAVKRKISEILSGLNFLEVSNYHLTNFQDQFTKMDIPEKQAQGFIEVEESKTDYSILRKDLTHYMLKIISENTDSEYPQNIFEAGRVFEKKHEIKEKEKLSIAITPGNFTQIKQVVEYLFKMLGLSFEFKEAEKPTQYFIEGRTADIIFNEKVIGQLGEIHPKVLRNWKIKMPIALLEISLKEIFEKLR